MMAVDPVHNGFTAGMQGPEADIVYGQIFLLQNGISGDGQLRFVMAEHRENDYR